MSGKDKREWAQENTSLLPTYNLIIAFFNAVVNPWYHQVRRVVPYALFLATDARPFITACVVYDDSGTAILADTRYYGELEISLAETCAVRDCWLDCVRRNLFTDHHFAITGIDNTTASRCLAKEYSGSTLLDLVVQESILTLPSHIQPLYIDLRTDLNIADIPGTWSIDALKSTHAVLRDKQFRALTTAMQYFNVCDINWMSRSAVGM